MHLCSQGLSVHSLQDSPALTLGDILLSLSTDGAEIPPKEETGDHQDGIKLGGGAWGTHAFYKSLLPVSCRPRPVTRSRRHHEEFQCFPRNEEMQESGT